MSVKLSSLFFEIGARGDKFIATLTKTERDAKTWSGKLRKSTKVVALGFAAAGAAATAYAGAAAAIYKRNAAEITQQAKLAGRLETTVGNMQVLGVAARAAGLDQEGLNDTLGDFVERLGEAAIDGGEPAEALDLLGLSTERLRKLDPADALREVLHAMEALPDAGIRAATGAKLFGDQGIQATGLLSAAFEEAEAKIELLGGSLSELEVAQVVGASKAVADVGLAASLSAQRMTAKLAPGIAVVAEQLFSAAQQGSQFDDTIDSLVVSALGGLSSVAGGVGAVIRFIDGREEIASFGLLGYMFYGKRGFALGAALGTVAGSVKDTFDSLRVGFGEGTTDNVNFIIAEIDRLESKLKLRNLPGLDAVFGDEGDENIQKRINGLRFQLSIQRQIVTLNGEGDNLFASALDETVSLTSAAADGFDLLKASLEEVQENYGKFVDATSSANGDRSGATPLYSEAQAVADRAANQALYGADIIDYKLYQDSRTEAALNAVEIRREIQEREFADNQIENVVLFDAYAQLQESQNESLSTLADEQAAQAAATTSFFASQAQEAAQFQQTWTDFQSAGAAGRISIFKQETTASLGILAQHSKTFFKLHQAVGLADATVSVATGIARALELPFPANLFAAFKTGLAGFAQIRQIAAAKPGKAGFTTEGLAGGGGGVSPVSDVSGGSGSVGDQVAAPTSAIRQILVRPIVYTTPGASIDQRAAELAQTTEHMHKHDLLGVDGEGNPVATVSNSDSFYQRADPELASA